jgi:hypothetical protein
MAVEIQVEKESERFRITIVDAASRSTHFVGVTRQYYEKLTEGKVPVQELVRCSFEFLLEREPKESILPRFDLSAIARYFPEYEREIRARLAR